MSETLFEIPTPVATDVETAKWTERMMLDRLIARYAFSGGNGPRYTFAEHVRSRTGHNAPRIADFIAMSLWASDGEALHGHEVKVSRSDWLTELKCPEKADAFRPYMDYWWLVASDKGIVRDDLPDGWGLIVPAGDKLRIAKRAPRREPEPMPKTLMACYLRATAKTAQRSLVRNQRSVDRVAQALCRRFPESDFGENRVTARALLDTTRQAMSL